jgi:hypothetical protein
MKKKTMNEEPQKMTIKSRRRAARREDKIIIIIVYLFRDIYISFSCA